MNIQAELEQDLKLVNSHLVSFLPKPAAGAEHVYDAAVYSLENGGKRIRPLLCLAFAKAYGADCEAALAYACGVEFIHTYSLIHDDLPCMDNDDMRRGKPSCHIAFGEATALLAGDLLLTEAFGVLAESGLSAQQNAGAVSVLAACAGGRGMIGGQVLDLKYEQASPALEEVCAVHRSKTGALIYAACALGCIAAGAGEEALQTAKEYAYALGMAFQIRDDILDVVGDAQKLGKPVGSDAENDKTTYVSLVGLEQAEKDVQLFTQRAVDAVRPVDKNGVLTHIASLLADRQA